MTLISLLISSNSSHRSTLKSVSDRLCFMQLMSTKRIYAEGLFWIKRNLKSEMRVASCELRNMKKTEKKYENIANGFELVVI